jgi:serine/alanine adding enzyme
MIDKLQRSGIRVSLAEKRDAEIWDDYLAARSDSFFCQTTAWREVVESAYGHRPFYVMAWEGANLRGVLPLFLMESRLFGRVLASSPFASAGGICAESDAAEESLVERAITIAREQQVASLELKNVHESPCKGLARYNEYLNYELALDSLNPAWQKKTSAAHRMVRQAERFGLSTDEGHHLLPEFYEIMAANMRRLGTPMHSRLFYEKVLKSFANRASIFLVRQTKKAIAGALVLRHAGRNSVLHAGSLPEFLRLRPNNRLYWQIIQRSVASHAATLDMGRSLAGSGTAQFKESWGAVGQPLHYEYFLNGRKTLPQINQVNPRFAAARWMWRRLPLPLTKWLGPALIRSIP